MKLDELVLKHLEDLEQQATEVGLMRSDGGSYVDAEKLHKWASSVLNIIQRTYGETSTYFQNFSRAYEQKGFVKYITFLNLKGIFRAAKEDYERGYLFTVRGLIKAEDSTDILDQALDLFDAGYKDPACVLAGVSLEIAIKEICNRNSIPLAKLDAMNTELCKKGVYNMGMQKQVTAWAHWRNKAAHGEWSEYKEPDVKSMIEGVQRFVADYL